MILTRQQKLFRGNGSAPNARAIADATIRALSPAAWYRNATDVVSSGGFASIWADYASNAKGLVLPGVAGNYASTPDSVPLSITGDLDIQVRVALSDWTPSAVAQLAGKWVETGNQRAYLFYVAATSGNLTLFASVDGSASINQASSAAPTVSDGDTLWVRATLDVDNGAGAYEVKFYTGGSGETPTWVQLGATKTGASTTSIANTTAIVQIGQSEFGGGSVYSAGRWYRAIIKSGIDGTTVFDADFSSQTIGAGSFTESSSNAATVTINASGAAPAHIGKARDLLQGTGTNQPAYANGVFTFDGVDNYLKTNAFTLNQPATVILVAKQVTWTNGDYVFHGYSGATPLSYQGSGTPNLVFNCGLADINTNPDLAANTWGIMTFVADGASSAVYTNLNAGVTGSPGTNNFGGFTLSAASGGSAPSNMAFQEAILFDAALTGTQVTNVVTSLNNALTVF